MEIGNNFAVEIKSLDAYRLLNCLPISVVAKSDIRWVSVGREGDTIIVRPVMGEVAYEGMDRINGYNLKGDEDFTEISAGSFRARFYNKA